MKEGNKLKGIKRGNIHLLNKDLGEGVKDNPIQDRSTIVPDPRVCVPRLNSS